MMIMRTTLLATASLVFATANALAADLAGPEIIKLISGNTLYIDYAADNRSGAPGQGANYYTADGKVAIKFPDGKVQKGTWTLKDNSTCIVWEGLPVPPCTKYDKAGDKITLINLGTGKPRGTVSKVVAGNPEKL